MNASDLITLFSSILTAGGMLWGVFAWSIDKKFQNDQKIEALKKSNQDLKNEEIKTIIMDLKSKMTEIDVFNNNSTIAVMKQFQSFELAIKDYQKDIAIINEQIKQQKSEIEKLWKTVVTEIAPGIFRVSDKK